MKSDTFTVRVQPIQHRSFKRFLTVEVEQPSFCLKCSFKNCRKVFIFFFLELLPQKCAKTFLQHCAHSLHQQLSEVSVLQLKQRRSHSLPSDQLISLRGWFITSQGLRPSESRLIEAVRLISFSLVSIFMFDVQDLNSKWWDMPEQQAALR